MTTKLPNAIIGAKVTDKRIITPKFTQCEPGEHVVPRAFIRACVVCEVRHCIRPTHGCACATPLTRHEQLQLTAARNVLAATEEQPFYGLPGLPTPTPEAAQAIITRLTRKARKA